MAQFIKKKKGWAVRFYTDELDEKGQKKRIYLSGYKTKKDAENAMLEYLSNFKKTGRTIDNNITLKEYLEYFFENYIVTNTAPRTQRYYADIFRLHIIPYMGSIRLNNLKASLLQQYYLYCLNNKGLSKNSVKKHHRALHLALNYAMKWGLTYNNVTDMVEPPKPEKVIKHTLNKEQLNMFLEEVKGTSVYIPFLLLITTGLRRGEVCGLQIEDVDLEEGMLYIRHNLQRYNGKLNLTTTKTHRSSRPIALLPETIPILKKYELEIKKAKLANPAWQENNFYCKWLNDGRPIKPEYLTRVFKKIIKKLNFNEELTLHDLRHSHATILLEEGKHPKIVQERLGHSTIKTSMDLYSHVTPQLEKKEMQNVHILKNKF